MATAWTGWRMAGVDLVFPASCRAQAGAVLRVLPDAGRHDECRRKLQRDRICRGSRRTRVVCPRDGQGGVSRERNGYDQGSDRESCPEYRSTAIRTRRTLVCTVRYGNVMCSRGSVIPPVHSPDQGRGGADCDGAADDPVSVETERCDRSGPPCVQERASAGDILIRKAPASTIADLTKALQRTRFKPRVSIKVIGVRHGEKLHETLASREELARAEDMGGLYYRVALDDRDLNYDKYFTLGDRARASNSLIQLAKHETTCRRGNTSNSSCLFPRCVRS